MNTGLTIATLGNLTIQHNGEIITDFTYHKTEALLVYLVVERGNAHRRESLYTLLWPGMSEKSARNNLRQVLYALRQTIPQVASIHGDGTVPLLLADRQTIQIHPEAKIDLDVHNLDALITSTKQHTHTDLATCSHCRTDLEDALALYQGDFLENFYLPDSNLFEEWAEANRASYRQKKLDVLNTLAGIFIQLQDYAQACHYIEAQLVIDNLQEIAHRQMMELLVLSGQRVEAIRQYQELVRILDEELGVTPSKETTLLYERIQSEDFAPKPAQAGSIPTEGEPSEQDFFTQRYQIEAELGQGGMGMIYRAHDNALDRDVAIKILSNTDLGEEGKARLLNEAQTIARLNHPNIVTVYDVGEVTFTDLPGFGNLEGLTPFIVMEYVEGINLYQQPPEQIEEIVLIAQQICAALEQAHTHGIIHRDLKPENIMITPGGTVKLMDFGLARSLASRLTAEGKIIGTVFYMAPEQALGGKIDHRADLYALGVMLYELTTGELPFQADDPVAVISQHIHAPVVPSRTRNEQIPPALEALILELLRKDPAERPGSAREVFERLGAPEMLDTQALPVAEHSLLERIVRGRMVGRKEELQQARRLWGQAASGIGQLLLISGEPGVGKSRLMREIVTQVEVSGGQAFIGENQAEGNAPYAAFAQIARRALRAYPSDGLEIPNLVMAELIAIAPGLQVDYPGIAPNPPLEPESERHRLLDCFYRFITLLSQKKPLLLVLEDLHWADSGTLGLLGFLAQRTRELPVMLLGTYREVELDQALPFHETLLHLNRRNLRARLKLERLDQDQTREMLAVLFAEEITPEFLAGIYKETEGNPFFIEEVCKALVESGDWYFDEGKWHRPEMADMVIPQSIKVAVQSRLGKLSAEAQEILLNAAVIGREFDYQTLRQVTGKDEDTLIVSLEASFKAQLIEERREGEGEVFGFSHALIPAALRESLSGLRRKRMHRQIAQVIEGLQPEAYQRLAYHWSEAGDEEKGLDYTIKAADQARKIYANEDAIRLYSEALALLPENDPNRFEILENRSKVYSFLLKRDLELSDIKAMISITDAYGQRARKLSALLALARYHLAVFEISSGIEIAEQALLLARKLGDKKQEAQALFHLGHLYRDYHNRSIAQEYFKDAVKCAREANRDYEFAIMLGGLSNLYGESGDFVAQMETIKEMTDLSEKLGDKKLLSTSVFLLATAYWYQGNYQEGIPIAQKALQMTEDLGDLWFQLAVMNNLALFHYSMGNYDESEAIFLEILDMSEIRIVTYPINNLCSQYITSGDYEKRLVFIKNLLERAKSEQIGDFLTNLKHLLCETYCYLGDFPKAIQGMQSLISECAKQGNLIFLSHCNFLLGTIYIGNSEFKQGKAYLETALDISTQAHIDPYFIARIHLMMIYCEIKSEDPINTREKIIQLDEMAEMLIQIDKRYELAEIYYISALIYMIATPNTSEHRAKALKCAADAVTIAFTNLPIMGMLITLERMLYLYSIILRANDRLDEADDYLRQAYERVMLVAGKIQDDDLRCSYLGNVPDNREILKEAKERGIAS